MWPRLFLLVAIGPFLIFLYVIDASTVRIPLTYQPRTLPPDIHFWKSPYSYPADLRWKQFHQQEIEADPQMRLLTSKANVILNAVKGVSAKFQLKYVGVDELEPTYARYLDWPRLEIGSQESPSFNFCTTNNSTAGFFNIAASQDSRKSDRSKKPTWSMGKAVAVATEFLNAITDTSHVLLEVPRVEFKGAPDNEVGEWEVSWERKDGTGYDFGNGRAILNISETTGLVAAYVRLDDPYQPMAGMPMTQNEALKIAKRLHPSLGTESDDISDYKASSAKLWIVEPEEIWGAPCRLAWVFQLQPVRSKPVNYMDAQIVEVDAYTGEILLINAYL